MHQIRSFCIISIFTKNTKINFCILLFGEFYVFGKWNKSLFKILQKNYFRNLDSLCNDIQNECWYRFFLGLSNVFSLTFYLIHQISSFCMISIFNINTKINFCILLFNKFYVFGKWNKSLFKILQKKIIFVIWSLYTKICKIKDSVQFLSNYWMYLILHFILYINPVHFVWFRYLT